MCFVDVRGVYVCDREGEREREREREGEMEGAGVSERWEKERVGEEGRYREPGFIRSRSPWPYKNGWEFFVVFCCFHCILMGRVSKSGSSGETGEGILIKISHAGFVLQDYH